MPKLLEMVRGDTKQFEATCYLDDVVTPITGFLFYFTVKRRRTDDLVDQVFQKTIGSGITITDGPNGELLIQLLVSDTDDEIITERIGFVDYFYDLKLKNGSEIFTLEYGTFRIKKTTLLP
jgi:hypothetical protein